MPHKGASPQTTKGPSALREHFQLDWNIDIYFATVRYHTA